MRSAILAPLIALSLVVAVGPTDARRNKGNDLVRVITPVHKGTARAHPFVNLIVAFADDQAVDEGTFRARLGRRDITPEFVREEVVVPGTPPRTAVRLRAAIAQDEFKLGGKRQNRLRVEVRSQPQGRGKVRKDVDKVRFRVEEGENQAPVAVLGSGSDVIFPGIDLVFDGAASSDADLDRLSYEWDFGDGNALPADPTRATVTHQYGDGTPNVAVRLTVSDGQSSSTVETSLVGLPPLDAGRTPGILHVDVPGGSPPSGALGVLDFGAVAEGAATRTIRVSNVSTEPTSQLHARIGVSAPGVTVNPSDFKLGAEQSQDVIVTFTPTGPGHHGLADPTGCATRPDDCGASEIVVVASTCLPPEIPCDVRRPVVHTLIHGYGGAAPGAGPTLAAEPAFYNLFGLNTAVFFPDGQRAVVDDRVKLCQAPQNGVGTGDYCLVDADCAANGGVCSGTVTTPFSPVDLCADGTGGVYLMSDDGTFTDPNPLSETETSATIMRLQVDGSGNRTDAAILGRTTSGTTQIACDGKTPADDGRLFIAELRSVTLEGGNCFRDELEQLIAMKKSNGASPPPLLARIDAVEGQDLCDGDIDPVANLEVSRDGSTIYAAMSDTGLFQLRPIQRFLAPEIAGGFALHPDGGIVVVTANDSGTTGVLSVYKFFPNQAASGGIHLADLSPCATFTLPNNRALGSVSRTSFVGEHSFAVGRTRAGADDGTILVSFFSTGATLATTGQMRTLGLALRVQGVAAFDSPAGSTSCRALGLVNLDLVDLLNF